MDLFASACSHADRAWEVIVTGDPPDAISRDRTVGLELTRLAPVRVALSADRKPGSPAKERQSFRDRILSDAQHALKTDPGRGFHVHVTWMPVTWDDQPKISRHVKALVEALAETTRNVREEATRRAANEVAGDVVIDRGDLSDPLREYIASLSISWTPGIVEWGFTGACQSIVLTSPRPVQDIIDRKGADISRWSVCIQERWLVVHLDPSLFTDDPALIEGPYRSQFERVYLLDTVERTCRELGISPD